MERARAAKRVFLGLAVLCCAGVLTAVGFVVASRLAQREGPSEGPASGRPDARSGAAEDAAGFSELVAQVDRAVDERFARLGSGVRLTGPDKQFLLRAARTTLESHFADPPRAVTAKDWSDVPRNVASQTAKLFVTLISRGRVRGCTSAPGATLLERTVRATHKAIADDRFDGALRAEELPHTRVDITLVLEPQDVLVRNLALLCNEIEVGIHAFSLERAGRQAYFKSSVPVAHSFDLQQALERLGRKAGLGPDAYTDSATEIHKYLTLHFTESPVDRSPVDVYRYNLPVRQSAVTRAAQTRALRMCADYLARHVDPDGVLTYVYDVYRDRKENPEKNAARVRRLAATWLLAELGAHFKNEAYRAAARRSIEYFLERYYRHDPDKGFGYLQPGPDANLATAAFTVLCLVHIDDPTFHPEELKALTAFLLAMEDKAKGRLTPIYQPGGPPPSDEAFIASKEVYYPGEALTALMGLYGKTGDPALLGLAERVFDYYVRFYDRTPKKASVAPWQSKPYAAVFLVTGKKKYADFVLKMNDALLPEQVGVDARYPDKIGSFFSSAASVSTGVMVESLVEAYRVAEKLGDRERMKAYRQSVLLGNRFLIQCQYRPGNMFTAPNPALALGGVRSSVYESSVRVDAVQHTACALLKTLRHVPSLGESERSADRSDSQTP